MFQSLSQLASRTAEAVRERARRYPIGATLLSMLVMGTALVHEPDLSSRSFWDVVAFVVMIGAVVGGYDLVDEARPELPFGTTVTVLASLLVAVLSVVAYAFTAPLPADTTPLGWRTTPALMLASIGFFGALFTSIGFAISAALDWYFRDPEARVDFEEVP